jgi:hypothetical protein
MPSYRIIFLLSFMKIGTGVQEILRFSFSNLNGCNIGFTNEKELIWVQVA